jgi:hypothetical protein
MLEWQNYAWFILHSGWIIFNVVGWAWRRTRRWHLLTMGLTGFSWFGLGAFYGWGYCPCTDAHLQVRQQLGYDDVGSTYVQLLLQTILGVQVEARMAQIMALSVFTFIALAMLVVWWPRQRAPVLHSPGRCVTQ